MTNQNNESNQDSLTDSIKKIYMDKGAAISDMEAEEAAHNLVEFFKLLVEIDQKNKSH